MSINPSSSSNSTNNLSPEIQVSINPSSSSNSTNNLSPEVQEENWAANSIQVGVGFGTISLLLVCIQIKSQTLIFQTEPLLMQLCLILAAISSISLFHLPILEDGGKSLMGYVAAFSTSLWIVLLFFAISPVEGWVLLILWGIGLGLHAKNFYLCCHQFYDELVGNRDGQQ